MAKKKARKDPVFGDLIQVGGDLWKRSMELRFLGRLLRGQLTVDISEKTGLESNQILAFNDFSKRTDAIIADAEKAIYDYYRSICDDRRSQYGIVDPNDVLLPIIKSVSEVFKLVTFEGVTFPYVRSQPTFGLLCECTWENEHGLAVKFENGKVVDVGFQDIVL